MSNPIEEFKDEVRQNINNTRNSEEMKRVTKEWMFQSNIVKYSYNFRWMGRPIIQYPQDIVAMQEIIWDVKPDLIIETGIAHGGSLIFYASMMQLLDQNGHVLGIDIDIRDHNRKEIESHPMFKRITMIEGSSIDKEIVNQVHNFAKDYKKIMVVLDSCHTMDHVYEECKAYADLVSKGSYLVVMDTIIEEVFARSENLELEQLNRSWGKDNGPMSGMKKFLKETSRFVIDNEISDKIQITVAPEGYLKCIE